jgi:cytochrome c553
MRNALVPVVLLALAPACSRSSPPQEQPPPAAAAADVSGPSPAEEAHTTFSQICAACHGQDGKGDGPGAAQLTPKPRNYTDKAWQASVTDAQITNTILMGGAAVGKSPSMPAQPQLKDKPQVVAELVRIVRSYGQ